MDSMPMALRGLALVKTGDLEEVYAGMEETKLLRLAKFEYNDLEFQAKEALKTELARRGLLEGKTLFLINRQEDGPDDLEVKAIAVHFQNQVCPHCGKNRLANAYVLTRRIACLLVIFRQDELVFGCKECLAKKLRRKSLVTGLSLLFSVYFPLIPFYLSADYRLGEEIQAASEDIPSPDLLENIRRNIKTYRDILF